MAGISASFSQCNLSPILPHANTAAILAAARTFAPRSAGEEKGKENLEAFLKEEEMDPFLRGMKVELGLEM